MLNLEALRLRRAGGDDEQQAALHTPAPRIPLDAADAAIVARAQRDPAAFEPLYARYAGRVLGYCERRLGDRQSAEDATSQVFIRVLDALPNCRGETFRPWLFSIAFRVTTDILRARSREGPLPTLDRRIDPAPTPEETALAIEGTRRIQSLLAALSADQRQIVELRLAGLTGQEIAAVLNRSHGAVRIAQLRAYRKLRDLIAAGG